LVSSSLVSHCAGRKSSIVMSAHMAPSGGTMKCRCKVAGSKVRGAPPFSGKSGSVGWNGLTIVMGISKTAPRPGASALNPRMRVWCRPGGSPRGSTLKANPFPPCTMSMCPGISTQGSSQARATRISKPILSELGASSWNLGFTLAGCCVTLETSSG